MTKLYEKSQYIGNALKTARFRAEGLICVILVILGGFGLQPR